MAENLFNQIQNDYRLKQHREKTVRKELAAKEEVKDRLKDVLSSEVEKSLDVVDDAVAAADLTETLDEEEIQDLEARRKAATAIREKRLKKNTGFFGLFGKKKETEIEDDGPTYDDSFTKVEVKKDEPVLQSVGVTSETIISFDDDDEEIISVDVAFPSRIAAPVEESVPESEAVQAEGGFEEPVMGEASEVETVEDAISDIDVAEPADNINDVVVAAADEIEKSEEIVTADLETIGAQHEAGIAEQEAKVSSNGTTPEKSDEPTFEELLEKAIADDETKVEVEPVDVSDETALETQKTGPAPVVPEGAKLLADGKTIVRLNKKAHVYELVSGESVRSYKQRLFRDIDAVVDYFNRKECAATANA